MLEMHLKKVQSFSLFGRLIFPCAFRVELEDMRFALKALLSTAKENNRLLSIKEQSLVENCMKYFPEGVDHDYL